MSGSGLVAAFRSAGYQLGNPRSDWSAVKEDGTGVALTVWQDRIVKGAEPLFMDLRTRFIGDTRPGHRKRTQHIAFGLDQCGGLFDIILCRAVDPTAEPRKVYDAWHWTNRVGVIHPSEFDPVTGYFRIIFSPG